MARRPTPAGSGSSLDRFRRALILTREELWLKYIGLGGMAGIEDMTSYLAGRGDLGRLEHNTIAQALNEQYIDLGQNHLVPYLD
ncbi:MAG: hypothetical protein M3083_18795 [Actinomycetota bacterium]|nr:hypothetical protein [Actinomycetota bacterium]